MWRHVLRFCSIWILTMCELITVFLLFQAPDGSEYAYCKLCRDYLAPKVNDIRKHMYTMKHRKRAIASGLNVKQESVTLVAGTQGSGGGQTEGGLKVVQVPGSNDFTGIIHILYCRPAQTFDQNSKLVPRGVRSIVLFSE